MYCQEVLAGSMHFILDIPPTGGRQSRPPNGFTSYGLSHLYGMQIQDHITDDIDLALQYQ